LDRRAFEGRQPARQLGGRIIDVPQSLNLHTHRGGFAYPRRDVENLDRYFARYGLSSGDYAWRAWGRYLRGELGR